MRALPSILILTLCASASCQQSKWVTLQDAQEHAFSLDVPGGWNVSGGVYRFTMLEPRLWVDMKSPDGKTEIRLRDPAAPQTYEVPNALYTRYGLREGTIIPSGMGTRYMLLSYQPGQLFANLYGRVRFGQTCQTLEAKKMDVLEPLFRPPFPAQREDAGDVVFRCVANGQEMVAYVVAETQFLPIPGRGYIPDMSLWSLVGLSSFITPKEQATETWKIMWHSILTFAINPEWWAQLTKAFTGAAQASAVRTQASIAQSTARFEQNQARMQSQTEDFNRILTGQTLRVDPATRKQIEVPTGAWNTYWINAAGQRVSSALSPGPAFHQLEAPK